MATVVMRHCCNHCAKACKSSVNAPNYFTCSLSLPTGTATACMVADTSIPAASGFTIGSDKTLPDFDLIFAPLSIVSLFYKALPA